MPRSARACVHSPIRWVMAGSRKYAPDVGCRSADVFVVRYDLVQARMRVYEVAKEFKIEPEKLMQLLRGMSVAVRSEASSVDDATVAKLRVRFERERRAGHGDAVDS